MISLRKAGLLALLWVIAAGIVHPGGLPCPYNIGYCQQHNGTFLVNTGEVCNFTNHVLSDTCATLKQAIESGNSTAACPTWSGAACLVPPPPPPPPPQPVPSGDSPGTGGSAQTANAPPSVQASAPAAVRPQPKANYPTTSLDLEFAQAAETPARIAQRVQQKIKDLMKDEKAKEKLDTTVVYWLQKKLVPLSEGNEVGLIKGDFYTVAPQGTKPGKLLKENVAVVATKSEADAFEAARRGTASGKPSVVVGIKNGLCYAAEPEGAQSPDEASEGPGECYLFWGEGKILRKP